MRELTASRAIRGLLVFQLAAGAALVASDVTGSFRGFSWGGTDAPTFDAPVRPGDQRRRYDPARLPALPGDPDQRQTRPTGDFPTRLVFREDGSRILAEGSIEAGDAARFRDFLDGRTPSEIVINSPGGSVGDALDIGRQIRDAGVSTRMEPGTVCFSACPYLFAGGINRIAPDDAMLGVHQHYFGESTVLPAFMAVEDVQRGQGMVMAHLDAMGVDPLLMQHSLTTPPEEIYVLLPEELDRYALRTAAD
jgi:hypothetical protein